MTILFAGGEDTSIAVIGAAIENTTNTLFYRSAFARVAISATNGTSTADPPANRLQTAAFTSSSVLWIHMNASLNGITSTSDVQGLIVRSPDAVSRILIRQTGTSGQIKVSSRNSAGAFTDLATASSNFVTQTNTKVDIKIDYSSSGGVSVWFDGAQVINFSGDPRTDAATQLNQVEFASFNNRASGSTIGTFWSEIIVADEDTRGMALWTLAPQAAGNTQSWTPNTLANINETTINDATLISTTANNDLSQWTTPTSPPSGSWGVKAIAQDARVRVGTTGPQHFDWSLRTASTDYTAGTSNAPSTSFGNFNNQLWVTNPNTLGAWAITDIASGFNLGIKSLA